jgi:hypothetical protein
VLGVVVLGSLATALNKDNVNDLEVYSPSTRWPAGGQFAYLFIGIVFFASFAYLNSPA